MERRPLAPLARAQDEGRLSREGRGRVEKSRTRESKATCAIGHVPDGSISWAGVRGGGARRAIDAAIPILQVSTSESMCCIVSYSASPAITDPPGELM